MAQLGGSMTDGVGCIVACGGAVLRNMQLAWRPGTVFLVSALFPIGMWRSTAYTNTVCEQIMNKAVFALQCVAKFYHAFAE